jgi:hypothetical protein
MPRGSLYSIEGEPGQKTSQIKVLRDRLQNQEPCSDASKCFEARIGLPKAPLPKEVKLTQCSSPWGCRHLSRDHTSLRDSAGPPPYRLPTNASVKRTCRSRDHKFPARPQSWRHTLVHHQAASLLFSDIRLKNSTRHKRQGQATGALRLGKKGGRKVSHRVERERFRTNSEQPLGFSRGGLGDRLRERGAGLRERERE